MINTFPLDGPVNLSVRLGHGSVRVETADDLAEARVELTGGEHAVARTRVAMSGPTLTVHAERQGGLADLLALGRAGKGESVHAVITVPTGTAMRLMSVSAPVTVTGSSGSVDVASGAGDVTFDTVDGDVSLRCGAVTAAFAHVTGSARLHTAAGTVRIGELDGDLRAGCARGRLTIGVVRGAVHSRSGAGEANLDAVYGNVDLATGSGAISIGLPAGVAARMDVVTGSGRVRSELPVTDTPARSDSSITVRARTGQGDVRVFRAAAA